MEALKLKIFDVLTEKITVSEFENWLYNTEEFMNQINSNPFYFNVVSINYKSNNWVFELNNLTRENLDSDYLEILNIKNICLSLILTESFQETHKVLRTSLRGFDYDTDYSILWELSRLENCFGLIKDGFSEKGTQEIEVKFQAKKTIELIKKANGFDELKYELEKN